MSGRIPPGFFITGTDTGVGKTVVAAGLAALFRKNGLNVGVMKPIQTGCASRNGERIATDARFLLQASGADDPVDQVCLCRFKIPAAPLVAAEHEGKTIDLDHIEDSYRRLSSRHQVMVVEGIGGLLTPITPTETVMDLARRLKLPLIIVAHTRLGTLNHTLLTVRYAQQAEATVMGIILNRTGRASRSLAERTNPEVLSRLCSVPVLGTIPFMSGISVEKGRLGRMNVRSFGHHLKEGLHHLGIKLNP
ncbi:MAG: dethiobiotin synthase [Nitrospirae bacterium]|nr:dethiobiotin synthase [Nitrospirota bacterium]